MSIARSGGFTCVVVLSLFTAGCSKKRETVQPAPPDSPVIVRGGSIDFLALKSVTWTSTGSSCHPPNTNPCYTASPSLDTTKITIAGITNGPFTLPETQPWTMMVYESKDGSYTPDTTGVFMCSSNMSGVCDTTALNGYVTIQATTGDGFYDTSTNMDEKYHHPGCLLGGGHFCEAMAAVDLTVNGGTTRYTCRASIGCFVYIGSF